MKGYTFLSLIAVGLTPAANAFIRFPCSQLVTERFDPLVTPGQVSPHLHQIVGGNAFDLAMDPSVDISKTSTCTSCRFVEDKSNYWTAVLYFKHPNGSYIRVPQMANHNTGPGLQSGGMTVYYFQPNPPTKNLSLTIFPPGFRMILGDPMRRTDNIPADKTASKAVTFRCFQGDDPGPFGSPGNSPEDSVGFPQKICTGGIRSNFFFPQCWNGVDLDPPDHASHMAQPEGTPGADGLQFFGTDCPASHPVRVPLLFMEIVWDTRPFNDPELWPKDGSQPFVFSMGDPTGYGQHADYVFGWEGDSLKRAMDTCLTGSGIPADCPVLTWQSTEEMNQCRQSVKVDEVTERQYLDKLPGCNPIQAGPGPATMIEDCNAISTTLTDAPHPTEAPELIVPPWSVCYDGPGTHTLAPNCDATTSAAPTVTTLPEMVTPAPERRWGAAIARDV